MLYGCYANLCSFSLDRIESKVTNIGLTLENEIRPRLNTIESCYTSTYDRYKDSVEDYESIKQVIYIKIYTFYCNSYFYML